ncbi:hypothetical protein LL037_18740 [Clostridium estertheticum]|uniref:hypothetical protein n=1 Tax=Clostridium estertheticum TaxID=238834 RepID=UPI001C0E0D41|nr:hypothetical protein [Clostridium estertheticum]MBU3198507.1 hypothetical protein [Clostridium estertheticum]WAG64489.1 hypothetical protein LL037_18740 [Clostridium estertheticum]
MNIRFNNLIDFDYYARWSYENLIFHQPQIKTEGLYNDGNRFYVVCSELNCKLLALDGTPIDEWFRKNMSIGSNIEIVHEKPIDAKKIMERSINEIVNLKGNPRNRRDVITDLILYLPNTFPVIVFKETKIGEAIIYVERDLNEEEISLLTQAIQKCELPGEFKIISDPLKTNNPVPFRYENGQGDIDLIPSKLIAKDISPTLKKLLEEDDEFWMKNRLDIFSG